MKKFHKKTIFSLASAVLLSSGMLISTQASADYKRCVLEKTVTRPFDSSQAFCLTDPVPLTLGKVAYYYGAVCSDNRRSNLAEAQIGVYLEHPTDPNQAAEIVIKRTEDQLVNLGRTAHLVTGQFIVPASGNYTAEVFVSNVDLKTKPTRLVKIRAIITDNPIEIPNKEHLRSLCD